MFPPLFTPSSPNTRRERDRESLVFVSQIEIFWSRCLGPRRPEPSGAWSRAGAGHRSCGDNVPGKYWGDPSGAPSDFGFFPLSGPTLASARAKWAIKLQRLLLNWLYYIWLGLDVVLRAGILEQFPPRDAEIEICWCKWLKVWDNVSLNNQEMGSKRVVKWRGRGLRCWRRILRLRCPSLRSIPGPRPDYGSFTCGHCHTIICV